MKLIKMIRKYKNIAVILIISLLLLSGCVTSEEEKAYIDLCISHNSQTRSVWMVL